MFDIHSHILPSLDDGAADISVSLDMARMAVENGVTVQACTPHILPGVYNNRGSQIREATLKLQAVLDEEGIPLRLVPGADVGLVPDMVGGLQSGDILSLADSRYVLVETPSQVAPIRLADSLFNMMIAGYHPIFTHPERLAWIESHYHLIEQLTRAGIWMQITASSLLGAFGRRPQYWAERMMDEGNVHIIASDAHNTGRRPPNLLQGREAAARRVGQLEATHMVVTRPLCILANDLPSSVSGPIVVGVKAELPDEKEPIRLDGPSHAYQASASYQERGGDTGLRALFDRMRHFIQRKFE